LVAELLMLLVDQVGDGGWRAQAPTVEDGVSEGPGVLGELVVGAGWPMQGVPGDVLVVMPAVGPGMRPPEQARDLPGFDVQPPDRLAVLQHDAWPGKARSPQPYAGDVVALVVVTPGGEVRIGQWPVLQLKRQLRPVSHQHADISAAGLVRRRPLDQRRFHLGVMLRHLRYSPFAVGVPCRFWPMASFVCCACGMGEVGAAGTQDLTLHHERDGSAFLKAVHADESTVAAETLGTPVIEWHVIDMHTGTIGKVPADDQKVVKHEGMSFLGIQVWEGHTLWCCRQA